MNGCGRTGPWRPITRLDADAAALYIRRAMKTFVPTLLLLVILCAADRPQSLSKGKVLILKTEYTIEGDIERDGDSYCIRRKIGETRIPAERALALVASLPDAYAYLRGRINLGDPDERLRLARWCHINGLQQEALAELRAAAELRPSHAETHRLLQYWQQTPATHVGPRLAGGAATPGKPGTNASGTSPLEVTTESLGLFAMRVQPILMNTCARCHATGHGGSFRLSQVFEDNLNNRRSLERNLAAVLAEVDVNQPESSRLLIKAVSDHAHTGHPPLRDRQSAPYRTLENWVKLTVADNPHLLEKSEIRNQKSEASIPRVGEAPVKSSGKSQWGTEAPAKTAAPLSSPPQKEKKAAPAATKDTGGTPNDPYDPEPFNRKMHPDANKQPPKR